jgi:hypothetical protein
MRSSSPALYVVCAEPSAVGSAGGGPDTPRGRLNTLRDFTSMTKTRSHYPITIYALTVICALGLASVALGNADGWVLIAGGVTAISVSLARLHVILDRRRARVDFRLLPVDAPPGLSRRP